MDYKVLLDVAMPAEPAVDGVLHGINWIIAFIIIAFLIAIVSIIIIRKGIKKYKVNEQSDATIEANVGAEDKAKEE